MKKRVGLKFCGGCNPDYDRAEAVRALSERLEGKIEFVDWRDNSSDKILIIAGCDTCCVEFEGISRSKVVIHRATLDADRVIRELLG